MEMAIDFAAGIATAQWQFQWKSLKTLKQQQHRTDCSNDGCTVRLFPVRPIESAAALLERQCWLALWPVDWRLGDLCKWWFRRRKRQNKNDNKKARLMMIIATANWTNQCRQWRRLMKIMKLKCVLQSDQTQWCSESTHTERKGSIQRTDTSTLAHHQTQTRAHNWLPVCRQQQ